MATHTGTRSLVSSRDLQPAHVFAARGPQPKTFLKIKKSIKIMKYTTINGKETPYGVHHSRLTPADINVVKDCVAMLKGPFRSDAARAQASYQKYKSIQGNYPGFERGLSTFSRLHASSLLKIRAEAMEKQAEDAHQGNETEHKQKVQDLERELAAANLLAFGGPRVKTREGCCSCQGNG